MSFVVSERLPDVGAFGAVYEDFVQAMTSAAERGESVLGARIRAHLGQDPKELPTTSVAALASPLRASWQPTRATAGRVRATAETTQKEIAARRVGYVDKHVLDRPG